MSGRQNRRARITARMAGFGLLESMLLVLLLGGLLMAGYTWLLAEQTREHAEQQAAFLALADRQVAGFAEVQQRLPCVDVDGDGYEDCANLSNKGWLPVHTLGLTSEGAQPGMPRLRYIVYRSGNDLALLTNNFNPGNWDHSEVYPFTAANAFDFCSVLDGAMVASAATAAQNAAHFNTTAGVRRNVAYGLALGGDVDRSGSGELFDGDNAVTADPLLSAPYRGADANYDDAVRLRTFSSLAGALNCPGNLGALRAMALAADVIVEVNSDLEELKGNATMASITTGLQLAKSIVDVVIAGIGMTKAITSLTIASAQLAAAIALCAILIGCADIPRAAAAVGFATAAVVLQGVTIGLNVAATVAVTVAFAKVVNVARKLGAIVDPDVQAEIDQITEGKNLYQSALDEINASLAKARADLATAQNKEAAARNKYNTSVNDRNGWQTDANALVDALHSDADARAAGRAALLAYTRAVDSRVLRDATLAKAQNERSSLIDQRAVLTNNRADLQAKRAGESNPDKQKSLDRQIATLQDQLTELAPKVTSATSAVNAAQSAKNTAAAAESAALTEAYNKNSDFNFLINLYAYASLADKVQVNLYALQQAQEETKALYNLINDPDDGLLAAKAQMEGIIAGTVPDAGGSLVEIWGGAVDILRAMDAKGVTR